MIVSLFESMHQSAPYARILSWDEFSEHFDPHVFTYTRKTDVPCFSPAEYPPDTNRAASRVQRVHFGVLDLDKITDDNLTTLLEAIADTAHIFYTTWSHHKYAPLWAARLVVPFSRPVLPSEWPTFWKRLNHKFGNIADPACKDPSRIYFIPAAPAGTESDAVFHIQPGPALDVEEILTTPIPENAIVPTEVISREEFETFAQTMRRKHTTHHKKIGGRLLSLLAGEPFAELGEVDNTIFQLTGVIVEQWPGVSPDTLARFFQASIETMTALHPDCHTLQDVQKKIERHQEQLAADRAEQEQANLVQRGLYIRQAFANGRSEPYTTDELTKFCNDARTTPEAFTKRWVIQSGSNYYLFFNGSYLPSVPEKAASNAALRDLSPAISAGLDLWKVSLRGDLTPKTPNELTRDFGTVASNIVVDLSATYATFEDTTRTLIEAPCPLRDLQPAYDLQVDEWLTYFAGPHYETLCDWMAVVTHLQEPCAALYLDGVPGAGKTLLADGLARLWTVERPTALDQAMSGFNDGLTACPLVLADETIPRDHRGNVRTAELRQFIQARNRPLSRKFQPDASLRGAVRLIITANNKELLISNEALNTNDIQAIIDRIIYIYCPASAARYLRAVDTRSMVREDRIARFALWLAGARSIKRGRRFLVEGSDPTLHRTLTTSTGLRSAICNWLVSYLLLPRTADTAAGMLIRRHEGQLLVTSRGLAGFWQLYPTNEAAPPAGRVAQALSGLSSGKKQMRALDGIRTNYHVIDIGNLTEWAERNGFAMAETLIDAMKMDTPRPKGIKR